MFDCWSQLSNEPRLAMELARLYINGVWLAVALAPPRIQEKCLHITWIETLDLQ